MRGKGRIPILVLLVSATLGWASLAQDAGTEAGISPALGLRSDGSRQIPVGGRGCGLASGWIGPNAGEEQSPPPSLPSSGPPSPRADDTSLLQATKVWDSGSQSWLVQLDWVDALFPAGPFTVLNSPYPDFHTAVTTVEKGITSTGRVCTTDSSKKLECFEVANESIASVAVQDLGYDPRPAPGTATYPPGTYWWDGQITVSASYLDLIPSANLAHFYDRPAKATATTADPANQAFASNATFRIPADTRSSYLRVESGARPSPYSGYLRMVAPGVTFGSINGLSWVPQSGCVYGADGAGGAIKWVDIFKVSPQSGDLVSGLTNPLISKVSNNGIVAFVSGVAGAAEISYFFASSQIPPPSPTVYRYAYTHDDQFTRSITPAGIALLPDGSACFIADASTGKVVKIPANAGPGNSTIVDNWGRNAWTFPPSPAGIDADTYGQVYLGYAVSSYWYTGHITYNGLSFVSDGSTCQYVNGAWVCTVPHFIEADRDMGSGIFTAPYVYADHAFCEAFNRNDIERVTGETGTGTYPPWYLGAQVWDYGDGQHIELTQDWTYWVQPHYPMRVILNNNGKTSSEVAYPYAAQTQDRIIKLTANGWPYRTIRLRLIDPPDYSAYAPQDGWPGASKALPYEGNDNKSGASDVFGLTTDPNGAGAVPAMDLSFSNGEWAKDFYLKLPARYSGNNFRVAVQKITPGTTQPVPNKNAALSSVYTSWKRVLVERDKMFRRGGLLAQDAHINDSTIYLAKIWDAATSKWVRADNVQLNDRLAIFDTSSTFEGAHDEACVIGLDPTNDATRWVIITLGNLQCGGGFVLTHDYSSSVDGAGNWTFASGTRSAGVGVIANSSGVPYDTSRNQINSANSAFYDADMRSVEETYSDAFLEFIAPSNGMGAVPYLPKAFFDDPANGWTNAIYFGIRWFANYAPPNNYFQLMGASSETGFDAQTSSANNLSQIMVQNIIDYADPEPQRTYRCQSTTNHEEGHQFDVNPDSCPGHDSRDAWCNGTYCSDTCLMDPARNRTDNTDRFDTQCLFTGEPSSGQVQCQPAPAPPQSWAIGDGAIRRETDPK